MRVSPIAASFVQSSPYRSSGPTPSSCNPEAPDDAEWIHSRAPTPPSAPLSTLLGAPLGTLLALSLDATAGPLFDFLVAQEFFMSVKLAVQ
ncbi:hypothetical protein J6590_082416 [Homalodisca vitripennis]|nr:hypothetical protein J6590_082416 [Homalodisca vitripennis]